MDPLSITASVIGISGACASVIKTLKDVHDRYKQADLTILAICSETSAVQAALSQIESLLSRDVDAVVARFHEQPVLASAFDTSITGCTLLYSCLESELEELAAALRRDGSLDWKRKFKAVWKQDTMTGFQQQIRGQEIALTTLLQGLQMESLIEVHRLLQDQQAQLTQIDKNTSNLRKEYPESRVPESVFTDRRSAGSVFGAADSGLGAEDFAFDDVIVNSKAYRRAMALAEAQFNKLEIQDDESEKAGIGSDTSGAEASVQQVQTVVPHTDGVSHDSKAWQAPADCRSFVTSKTALDERMPRLDMDWAVTFALARTDLEGRNKTDLQFQNVYWEILQTEHLFISQLSVVQRLYVDQLLNSWPVLVKQPASFADKVFGDMAALGEAHKKVLYLPLLQLWERDGAWAAFDPGPFVALFTTARELHLSFCDTFPSRKELLGNEAQSNSRFAEYLQSMQSHPWSARLSYDTFLKAPITRLQRCKLLLATLGKITSSSGTKAAIAGVEGELTELLTECGSRLHTAELEALRQKLTSLLPPGRALEIDIADADVESMKSGTLLCLLESSVLSADLSNWRTCDVYLLDDALIIAPTKDRTDSQPPIAVLAVKIYELDRVEYSSRPLKLGRFVSGTLSRITSSRRTETVWPLQFPLSSQVDRLYTIGFPSQAEQRQWNDRLQGIMMTSRAPDATR